MIEYTPNREWFRDLRHLGTSWTLRRIARAVLAVGVYSLAVCFISLRLNMDGQRSISNAFSLLGLILSIVLAFRTSTAYERWWEGRKEWGILVNHSTNLAIQLNAILPPDDRELRASYARLIGDFALALSRHLRDEGGPVGSNGATNQSPASVARAIVAQIFEARRDGTIDGSDAIFLITHAQGLINVAGDCERIKKTPIPFSYSVFIKLFIVLYAAMLPVGLVPEYGYLAVPLTMLVVFALLGLELMAEEIEDPFGTDCNDLPTATIAAAIQSETARLLGTSGPALAPTPEPYSKIF